MNYITLTQAIKTKSKSLTVLPTLFLLFFFSASSYASLPDCSTISGTAEPGKNCLFFGQKLCNIVPNVDYTIPSSSIISSGTTPNHRVNCSNLSDLPLCSDIDGSGTAFPGKNCVKECNDPSFTGDPGDVRGEDFAVHDRECIRFCDDLETGITANPGVNCVARKCHHFSESETPDPSSNCNILPCNLLTVDELNDDKFGSHDSKQYCDGSEVKCYEFTKEQLPFILYREKNTMCQIHQCKPDSNTCGSDDTLNISQKYPNADPTLNDPSTLENQEYKDDYIKYINAGVPLENNFLCSTIICKPVIKRQLRCTPFAAENPTTRNGDCDTNGAGSICNGGYCYKTIDCNLSANSNEAECATSDIDDQGPPEGDPLLSWFYRPKPSSKAVDGNGLIIEMSENEENQLCYTQSQMENVHEWGNRVKIDFGLLGTLDLGYHHDYAGMDSRSPGMCGHGRKVLGSRGQQYLYMCGTDGLVYKKANDDSGYYVGYAYTSYGEQSGEHQVTVCFRFNNAMVPGKTCGERECGLTCAFNCRPAGAPHWGGGSQVCGREVCHTLKINDDNPDECMIDDELTNNTPNRNCMKVVDNVLRMRAVKYGKHICTFMDTSFHLAYDPMFFGAEDKILTGVPGGPYCASGYLKEDEENEGELICDGAKNSNDDPGLAHIWRALRQVKYIQNNQPDGRARGYLTREGVLFPEQECPKVIERIGPPRLYNLANFSNSIRLFIPPVYILNARTTKGGNVSLPSKAKDPFGKTDFHYPEIEVRFGSATQKLSLDLGKTGYEIDEEDIDPNGSATVTTSVGNLEYSVELIVRKEYNSISKEPTFCLYRRVKNENDVYLEPARIECVSRNLPEIDNAFARSLDPTLDPKKLVVYPDPTNVYNSSRIAIKYLGGFGPNGVDDNCTGDDICTEELKLDNEVVEFKTCDKSVEKYEICVQRETCSKLNIECIKNEIDMHDAEIAGNEIDTLLAYRRQCNEVILPKCNEKKGITSDPLASILNPNPDSSEGDPKAYGWFNELCIVNGFEEKLKDIFAYELPNNIKGKCIVSPLSPYLTDSDSDTNCDDGGKAPNCLCVEAGEDDSPPSGQEIRKQTPREAGLCIDMPEPKTCLALSYVTTPSPDQGDPYYVAHSLNKTTYNNATGVHDSHKYRNSGKPAPDEIVQMGHAEFPVSIMGMSNVVGTCNGFWQEKKNVVGVAIPPKLDCLADGLNARWDNIVDGCIRYSCQSYRTSGPDADGNYQGGYGASEAGENKGLSNGFATWNSFTKTNDFLESTSAIDCLTGFKRKDALATTSSGTVTGSNLTIASVYGLITGYTGGTLPTRQCNQLGQWLAPTNVCERISCPADIPPTPTSITDPAWTRWENSAGATFPSVNASRSDLRIQTESVSSGTCNEDLGFFQAPGGNAPTRECDHLGNWGEVINPCVTHCEAVSTFSAANNFNNGYAYWEGVLNVPIGGEVDGPFNGCIAGFKPYPYPPLKDKYGNDLTISASGPYRTDSGVNSSLTTIPQDVSLDTRAAGNPQRVCKSVVTAGGNSNVWTVTSSSCIQGCPSAGDDPRIGAGKTQHPGRNGTITIEWPSAAFGETVYMTNPGGAYTNSLNTMTQQNSSHYHNNRTNGYYIMSRVCGSDGKWQAPVPHCATKSASIGSSNAIFNNPSNSVPVGSNATGSCLPGYHKDDYNTATISYYQCSYKDSSNKIDEVFYNKVGGKDCKKYCEVNSSHNFGGNTADISSSSISVNGLVDPADNDRKQVNLNCASGMGSQIVGGSRTNAFDSCGRTSNFFGFPIGDSDRSASRPYVLCQSNATWTSVYNPCSPCRGCDSSSPRSGSTTCDVGRECFWTGGDYKQRFKFANWLSNVSISHNSTKTAGSGSAQTENHPHSCGAITQISAARIKAKCIDGQKSVIELKCAPCGDSCPY